MSSVTRTAGVAGTFIYSLNVTPFSAPVMRIYSDSARTILVAGPTTLVVVSGTTNQFTAPYGATLAAGTYFLKFSTVFTSGQPALDDTDDTLVLTAPTGGVAGCYCTVAQIRAFGIPNPPTDAALELACEAATTLINDRCDPYEFTQSTRTITRHDVRQPRILLPLPFTTITSVKVNGSETTDYVIETWGIRLCRAPGRSGCYSKVEVTATFGFAVTPTIVVTACTMLAAGIALQGLSGDSIVMDRIEGPDDRERDAGSSVKASAWANDALALLARYIVPGIG